MEYLVEVGLLGPLSFELDKQDGTPTAEMQRKLLALLIAHDSRVVPLPTLIDELWDEPPRSAVTIIQTYVLAIRKQMARLLQVEQAMITSDLLQTRARGYAFNTGACRFDLHDYLDTAEQGKIALAIGRDEVAIDLFVAAEQLWRGEALVDVECGMVLSAEAARLDQIRLANIELRLEAQLRQRRYRDVVIDLSALVIHHRLHERLHAYLMYALCLSGWRARAQGVFIDLRNAMADELGLEPCAKLQRLHRDILRASDTAVRDLLEGNHADYLFWHDDTQPAHLGRTRRPSLTGAG